MDNNSYLRRYQFPDDYKDIVESNKLLMIEDEKECFTYLGFIYYRTLRGLYEVCIEEDSEITWKNCMQAMRVSPAVRRIAQKVITDTLDDFLANHTYDFNNPVIEFIQDNEPGEWDDTLHTIHIFKNSEAAVSIISMFFLFHRSKVLCTFEEQ